LKHSSFEEDCTVVLTEKALHHNNYYFIRQLSRQLKSILVGSVLYDCYSQNKDELVLAFVLPTKDEFYIVASLGSEFSCLHFSEEINRAKRNTITLFNEILGLEVLDVIQYENERAFSFQFEEGMMLTFKLFGNRSNILLYKQDQLQSIFKNNLKQDKKFHPQNKTIHFSSDLLNANENQLQKIFYTFDDLFISYFEEAGFESKSDSEKMKLLEDTLTYLNAPRFYLTRFKEKVVLSVFKIGEVMDSFSEPVKAVNQFYHAHFKYNFLETRRNQVLSVIHSKINSSKVYLEKNKTKLGELIMERSPAQIGDLIMAHLHEIPNGSEKVTLLDFYSGNQIQVKLKKDISPQKNAENYYKKAKKKPVEIEMLERQIHNKEKQLAQLKEDQEKVEKINNHKELEPFELIYKKSSEKEEKEIAEKFKNYEFMGFQIYVGRNADNNDELTQKFAHKNDLWLHAKDVTGSHVIIKFQSGKKFPKPVIEAAASLAAFYSKRKNETLCPVLYTEKKFVRKVKGAPRGQVKVEKETVIMVVPKEL